MNHPDEDRKYVTAQVLSRDAVQSVPESLDLWPTSPSRIETRHVETTHGTKEGNWVFAFGKHPLILRVGISLALLAIILMPIAVPKVQAALREQLQRFGVLLMSATPNPTEGTAVGTSARLLLPVNVTAAQHQVPFHIYQPAWVPTGSTSRGAIVAPATGVRDRFSAPKVFRVDIALWPASGIVRWVPHPANTRGRRCELRVSPEHGAADAGQWASRGVYPRRVANGRTVERCGR